MVDNTVVGYVLLIKNNLFQLNMAYISPPNGSPIFYGAPAALLNNQEDLISASSNTNPEQTIIPNISKDEDNSLTKWYKRLGYLGRKVLVKIIVIIPGMILPEPTKLVKCEVCLLGKSKRYISKIPMARATSAFELIHTDTAHITPIGIDDVTGFMGFTAFLNDQCVYIQNTRKPDIVFITTYIDNLLIIGQDKAII